MKNYKFNIGEIAWFKYECVQEIRLVKITHRKFINGSPYYKCKKIRKVPHLVQPIVLEESIVEEYDLVPWMEQHIMGEWIDEGHLYNEDHEFDFEIPECGNNGCELIQELFDTSIEEEQILDKIHHYNERIDECIKRIKAYEITMCTLDKLIEQEAQNCVEYKKEISKLTDEKFDNDDREHLIDIYLYNRRLKY